MSQYRTVDFNHRITLQQMELVDMADKIRVLGIAPYAGLKELMQDIARQRSDVELEAYTGDLSHGVELALEHQRRGFAGIISRGGTAEMIRRVAGVPVTEVSFSVYDVLRAMKLAQNYDGKFAIVGFSGITKCAEILCNLLQYEVKIITIKSQEDAASRLETLKEQGFSMVLGDTVTAVKAKLTGMNGILITSGGESVEAAFDRAVEICESHRKNLEEIEFLHTLLSSCRDEMMVFSEKGEMRFSTFSTSKPDDEIVSFMGKNIAPVLERGERKFLKQQAGKADKSDRKVIEFFGRGFSTTSGRYCAFTMKQTPQLRAYSEQGVTFQNSADLLEDVSSVFCRSNSVGRGLMEKIEKCSRSDLPVLIIGEPGTGKDKTANSIYMRGRFSGNPIISIDCAVVSDKKWGMLLESEYSPFLEENFTIYIKNVEQLNEATSAWLVKYLDDYGICKKNRLIFSCVTRNNAEEALCSNLKNKLSCLLVKLLPLRQRPDDIPSLCSLYINEINAATGKGVIGLTPEAMTLMRDFYWEYNLIQLHRVLTQLVVLSDSSYISADEVTDILSAESQQKQQKPDAADCVLNLNQPLNEINRDIVEAVLSEEGMNQSKAARRLQISRSTLWRMLRK